MPTSSELVARKKAAEAWDAYMAGLRAAEAARAAQQPAPAPAPEPETPAAPVVPTEEQIGG